MRQELTELSFIMFACKPIESFTCKSTKYSRFTRKYVSEEKSAPTQDLTACAF
jgi:hypothetical protein